MKDTEAILFDLDGTLINSLPDIAQAANHAAAPWGITPRSDSEIRPLVGRGAAYLMARMRGETDVEAPHILAAVERFVAYYREHLTSLSQVYPGVREMLDHFRDLPKLVVSNKPEVLARGTLEQFGLAERFEGIFGGDSFENKKPDPLPLLKTLAPFASPSTKVLMVGDSKIDVEAGKRAGLTTVAVTYGWGDKDSLFQAEPDHVISDIRELMGLFRPAPRLKV